MTEEATVERTVHDTRSTSRLRRLACATAAVAVLAAVPVIILPQAEATAPAPLFEQIDTLDRFPEDARRLLGEVYVPTWENATTERNDIGAIMVPELRLLVQLYPSFATGKTGVVVRDLDTLTITKTAVLPGRFDRGTAGDWLHAVDTVGGRLFLVEYPNKAVVEVDLGTLAPRRWPFPNRVADRPFLPFLVGALTYDPHRDDLLVLWGGSSQSSAANTNTFLQTIDVDRGGPPPTTAPADTAGGLAGFHQVRSCTGPLPPTDFTDYNYSWEILVTEAHLYVPCQRLGHTGIVVRTARPTPGSAQRPAEEVVVGPVNVENAMADRTAGRLVMTTFADKEIWVFEAATMSFVGTVATGPPGNKQGPTGYGLDRATGRVFFQSPNFGLGVVEARFFPLPQARTAEPRVDGNERILSDARTDRVFVLEGSGVPGATTPKAQAYRIYKVGPAPVPPPPPDPDRNTADMDEQAGITEARFNAGASGYGARTVLAKGVVGVPPAPVAGVVAPTSEFFEKSGNSRCGFTDRELVAGRVSKAEYDTGSAAAEAVAVDTDGATKQDLDRPSRCDVEQKGGWQGLFGGTGPAGPELDKATQHKDDDPDKAGNESRWRWHRASCASSEGRPKDASGDTEAEPNTRTVAGLNTETTAGFGPSAVDCPEPGGVLTASATAGLAGSNLSVGKAWTETRISRSSEQGVTATVTSVAQDVRLALPDAGVVVTFAEIRSTATSSSDGRPPEKGREMSQHRVLIRGAQLNGAPLCDAETEETKPDPCEDLTGLVDRLNEVAAGRAVFRTGTGTNSGLDKALVKGSPKGAQTAVQKSAARQASDRVLVGDFTVEVPGLEVLTFNDNTKWGRARQLYQFAGVASSATYNIVLRPSGSPLADLGPFEGSFGALASGDDGSFAGDLGSYDEGDLDGNTAFDAAPTAAVDEGNGGGFWAPLRAVARGLRVFLTDPRHALLLLTAWALLGLPGALSRRRRLLAGVRAG